ncbi:hypothetical protein EMPS_08461 [Entomortierella parvispora]|uniref:Uncharacterized protein n=1 Tax=Entomortierella parvispora TaxID=205924 RepID=A0A9P3LZG4_9FUNG|nr:hypothetical protein EMPS_08461 [Entomortierella parvispora]
MNPPQNPPPIQANVGAPPPRLHTLQSVTELWRMVLGYLTPTEIGALRLVDQTTNTRSARWLDFGINLHYIFPALQSQEYGEDEIFPLLRTIAPKVKLLNLEVGDMDPIHHSTLPFTDLGERLLTGAHLEPTLMIQQGTFRAALGPTWDLIFFGPQVQAPVQRSQLFSMLTSLTLKLKRRTGEDHSINDLFDALVDDDAGFVIARQLTSIDIQSEERAHLEVNWRPLRAFLVASRLSLESLTLVYISVLPSPDSPMPGAGERMTALRTLKLDEFRIRNEHARVRFLRFVSPQVRTLIVRSIDYVKRTTSAGSIDIDPEFKLLEKLYMTGLSFPPDCVSSVVARVKTGNFKIMSIVFHKREDTSLMESLSLVPNFDLEEITLQPYSRSAENIVRSFFEFLCPALRSSSCCWFLRRLSFDGRYSNLPRFIKSQMAARVGPGLDNNTYRTALTPQVLQNIMPCAITLVSLRLVDSENRDINHPEVIPWLNKILRGLLNLREFKLDLPLSDLEIFREMGDRSQDNDGQGNQPEAVQEGIVLAGVVPAMDWQGERPFLEKIEIRLSHALVQFGVNIIERDLKRWFRFLQKLDAHPAPGA